VTEAVAKPQLRWSSVRDCPRKAALEGGPPDREWTDREQRILYRGRSLGRDYMDWLEAKYGVTAVEREVKVEWALGTGHIDGFLWKTQTALEILSSAHATDAMIHSKLVQLAGYMEHYEPALNGCLIVLDPGDFSEERYPVAKDTEAYALLVKEVHERIAALESWRAGGNLPARVCAKPSEAPGHFCRFADTCFEGWEAPPLPEVDRPEVLALAAAFALEKGNERAATAALDEVKGRRKEVEAQLAVELEGHPREVLSGSFKIRRTDVQRKPTLDLRKAELAGVLNVELLGEFMKPGAAYTTWTVERHEGSAGGIDYGEEPF